MFLARRLGEDVVCAGMFWIDEDSDVEEGAVVWADEVVEGSDVWVVEEVEDSG